MWCSFNLNFHLIGTKEGTSNNLGSKITAVKKMYTYAQEPLNMYFFGILRGGLRTIPFCQEKPDFHGNKIKKKTFPQTSYQCM